MRPVFISADASDLAFIEKLKQWLLDYEFEVVDGYNSADKIEPVIREALAVVLVLSQASIVAPEVSYQWSFAIGSSVPVLPLLRHVSELALHPRLNTLQHLDFSAEKPPWEALLKALHKIQARQQDSTLRAPSNAPAILQLAAQALDDADSKVRAAALATLADMDHPAAIELLVRALHHPVHQVRFGALIQLARHKDSRALPFLLEAIRCGWEGAKTWMLAMGPAAIPLLIEALGDEHAGVVSSAVIALGQIGGPAAASALVELLNREGVAERRQIMSALGDAAEPSAIPALIVAATDGDREVRNAAIGALVKCGVKSNTLPALLSVLIPALEDEYDQVGIGACRGLELSGEPEAVSALLHGAISIEDDQVRAFCRSALRNMQGDLSPLLRQKAAGCSPTELRRVYSLISEFKEEENVSFLVQGTRHPDPAIRASAVNGLEFSRAREAVEALLECLDDEDSFVRARALDCLSRINDPASVPKLKQYLDDEEIGVAAARILEGIATKECRRALRTWKDQRKK